jgi:hypothetical protein
LKSPFLHPESRRFESVIAQWYNILQDQELRKLNLLRNRQITPVKKSTNPLQHGRNNMNSFFSRFGLLAVLVAFLLPTNVVAQTLHDVGDVGTVVINPFTTIMDPADSVVVNGGQFQNGLAGFADRSIANITVNRGIGINQNGSTVTGLVDVRGGEFANEGTIGNVTVSGGTFMNRSDSIILGSLLMTGGTVNNIGLIDDLVYGGGTYNANENARIGNLSLYAGRQFDVNSLATIAGTFGVDSIGLAGADLVWNLSGSLGDNLGFFGWDDIFGVDFTGGEQVALFTVNWDGGYAEFNASNFGQAQSFGGMTIIATMDGIAITPEPATLAILGLGLAGLGYARRRQQMKVTAV